MDAQGFYDALGNDYDLMVSWKERLAREASFFASVFDEHHVRRVLDAACGTGMHAIAFAREGRDCVGADISPVMVEKARQNAHEAGVPVVFEIAGFGGLRGGIRGSFDAVTCLGNSIPHLLDDTSLHGALMDFGALLRPGGVLVIQNRNYDRLLRERQRFMPLASRVDDEGETLFLRITEYARQASVEDESIEFVLVTLKKRGGRWSQAVHSTPLRAVRRDTLESSLLRAGFSSVRVYGSYAFDPFDAPGANDLVAVAIR
jgi:glycine/sarcosine N-methyltransferase